MITGAARQRAAGRLTAILMLCMLMGGCSEPTPPEEAIRAVITQAVEYGESRDVQGLSGLISSDYEDIQQRRYRDVVATLLAVILRNKSVHLLHRIDQIEISNKTQARVKVYVAMAGQPIAGPDSLLNLRANLFLFELTLRLDGDDWLLTAGQWHRAVLADFL